MKRFAASVLAAFIFAAAPPASAQSFLTGDEVVKMLAGNTATGSQVTPAGTKTDFTIYLTADGKMKIRAVTKSLSQNSMRSGVWQLYQGQFCYHSARDIVWNCNKFQRLADDRLVMTDGMSPLRLEMTVRKGNVAKL